MSEQAFEQVDTAEMQDTAAIETDDYVFSKSDNPGTIVSKRSVKTFAVDVEEYKLIVREHWIEYAINMAWDQTILQRALFYDVTKFIAESSIDLLVYPYLRTLEVINDVEFVSYLTDSAALPEVENLKFKTKQGEKVNRLEKTRKYLSQAETIAGQILSGQQRLRILMSPSPTPHVETNEMRNGSTAEIQAQTKLIDDLQTKLNEKMQQVQKQIEAMNAHLANVAIDSGWDIYLPQPYADITKRNPVFEG